MPRETPRLPPMPRDGLRDLRIGWARRAADFDRPVNGHEDATLSSEPRPETLAECESDAAFVETYEREAE